MSDAIGSDGAERRPAVSALICTKGRAAMLTGCLASVAAALTDRDEIIVVEAGDGGTSDAIRELGDTAVSVRHIRADRAGKSHQLNLGLQAASGDVVVLTDDDARVESDWADRMAAEFSDPTVGIACGPVLGLSRAPRTPELTSPPPGEAPLETWKFAHGAAMAVRLDAARHVGGFDERLGPGASGCPCGEDHDLVLRTREQGWRVVVADVPPVQHLDWRSADENRSNALMYERGGGAIIGAAFRRSPRMGTRLLGRRVRHQRQILGADPRFGAKAIVAFAGGFAYGVRLPRRRWLERA